MTKKDLAKKLLPLLKTWESSKVELKMAEQIIDKLESLGAIMPDGYREALEKMDFTPVLKQPFKIGDTIQLAKNHPFGLHKGEVVDLRGPNNMIRIRLYDMADHEVFASLPQVRKMK
jgi:hypothetical protein